MKKLKQILFSMLLLVVGLVTVNAATAEQDIQLYHSVITNINTVADNNCIASMGPTFVDTFTANGGNVCITTGIKESGDSQYTVIAEAGNEGTGTTFFGKVTNGVTAAKIDLAKLVELLYTGKTAGKIKTMMLGADAKPASATEFVIKAGSDADTLYVYGAYKTGEDTYSNAATLVIKLVDGKLTYSIEKKDKTTTEVDDELRLAAAFGYYLVDLLMEASPNYDAAYLIVSDEDKQKLINEDFVKKYGEVRFVMSTEGPVYEGVYINLLLSDSINSDIIAFYEAATNNDGAENPGENPGDNGNANQDKPNDDSEEDNGDNPNTGAFINIFSIVALISVGTVMILGNRRKIFKL